MKRIVALALAFSLAACGDKPPEPASSPSPTATAAAPRTLVAADFDTLELGAKVGGPQGTDVETVLSAGNREIGRMVSFVACPKGVTECHPARLPQGTVYTYVNRITTAAAEYADGARATGAPSVYGATLFRTTRAVPGFNHALGYSRSEAQVALGVPDAISTSSDEGQLIWRVTEGTGWKPESTITFWWTSTIAPGGPETAYSLELDGEQAPGRGLFPAEPKRAKRPRSR